MSAIYWIKLVILANLKEVTLETINVAEAKSRFSELISRASTGERFIIQRRERPVAALIGAVELERLERSARAGRRLALAFGQSEAILEKVERSELHPAMAAFGLWRDDPDLAALMEEIVAERTKPSTRPNLDL
jgi:prevent-host-death family protein